ncbi:MAG: hypothetical protein ABSD58_06235 [Verrucomicrobiia bacterium]
MPKFAPPPPVAPGTWRVLLQAAADFAALEPWEFACDNDAVGLIDAVTGETRIGHVLGNAREVFAAVFYRRVGLRWILAMFSDAPDPEDMNNAEGIDSLQVEFVPKRELWKEDLAVLNAAGFKPTGKGCVWPRFRSSTPGWHPWYINQAEANQLLADLPRLTAFCKMFQKDPDLFGDRPPTEIPFLPATLPDRPLAPQDLDWRPLLPPPRAGFEPFRLAVDQLDKLRALPRKAGLECEFDCSLIPGASFIEDGRGCFGRISLLVETRRGLILGMELLSGGLAPGEATGRGLVRALLQANVLPEKIFIGGSRFQEVLQPLCDELEIQLCPVSSLPALDEAAAGLGDFLQARGISRSR